jgi:hypothetical protein
MLQTGSLRENSTAQAACATRALGSSGAVPPSPAITVEVMEWGYE